jgi:hypothetical protein
MSPRSSRSRRARTMVSFGVASVMAISLSAACAPQQMLCTADSAGLGDQRALMRRDLPGLAPKMGDCNARLLVVRSDDDLRRAYEGIGVPVNGATSTSDAGAAASPIDLPPVDWSRESVLLREATDAQAIRWMVVKDGKVTVGTQGCAGAGLVTATTCQVEMIAIDAVVSEAKLYSCDSVTCGGGGGVGARAERAP